MYFLTPSFVHVEGESLIIHIGGTV